MPRLRLAQHHAEAASPKTESLLHAPGHRHSASIARHAKILADNPHAAGAIVNLKQSITQRAKRIGDLPMDGYFLAGITSGIAVNIFNSGAGRASCQKKNSQS